MTAAITFCAKAYFRDRCVACLLLKQAYLTLQKSGAPKTIFNCKKEGSDEYHWNHLPVEVALPCVLPISLLRSGISTCWEVTGPSDNPIKAAVRVGCFMKVELLKQLFSELMFLIPEKGKGSGAQGRLVKVDYARGLVNHFFGGSPDAEKDRMVQSIMGTLKKVSECPQAVLAALKKCDPDTAADFSFVERQLENQIDLEKKQFAERRMRLSESSWNPHLIV